MRDHQRSLQKATRELDRERTKLEAQEKKLIIDIKANAKKGQMVSLKLNPILFSLSLYLLSSFCVSVCLTTLSNVDFDHDLRILVR